MLKKNHRKKITAVHKANIMKMVDGLFLDCCREVAKSYPDIKYEEMIVDNTCMQLTKNPNRFDVMLMPNLYGNIVSNVLCGLIGGPGLISGANYGTDCSIFEPGTRHVGLDLAGRNVANPTGIILTSCMMLRHLELVDYADQIEKALRKVAYEKKAVTADQSGTASTTDFTEAVINELIN